MNKYLFIGGCSIAGGILYNSVQNLKIDPNYDEYNRNIGYRKMACENALHDLRAERDYIMNEMIYAT